MCDLILENMCPNWASSSADAYAVDSMPRCIGDKMASSFWPEEDGKCR